MKRILLFLTFLFPLFVNAQAWQYHPFPTTTGNWTYRYHDDFGAPTTDLSCYSLFGDTSILGVNYKIIFSGGSKNGAIRESNKIIYFRPDTSSIEYVLYNFNLNQGDTLFHPFGGNPTNLDTLVVTWVDSIYTTNGYLRQIHFNFNTWIEGIGSMNYLLRPVGYAPISGNDQLECMEGDGVGKYPGGSSCPSCYAVGMKEQELVSDIKVSPNPFNYQTTIIFNVNQRNASIKMMDIAGREIKTIHFTGQQFIIDKGELKEGIYFVQTTDDQKNICNKKIVIQ